MDHNENYINIDLVNQLLIPKLKIIEKEDIFQIKELQMTIDEYEYISQFYVTACQVVVAQLVGVGSFLLPTQVRVSSMRHVALCETNILEILDPPMFSGFRGGLLWT
jgi:hypothetical protein